jgi:hypothetical protein
MGFVGVMWLVVVLIIGVFVLNLIAEYNFTYTSKNKPFLRFIALLKILWVTI